MSSLKKKVFLASRLPEKFDFLASRFGDSFALTQNHREADLIIVDLAHPLNLSWVPESSTQLVAVDLCCPPLLLAALDGPEDPAVLSMVKSLFPESGPVYNKREDLEKTLAWVNSVFPLYNARNLRDAKIDRISTDMVLQRVRLGESPQ
jgi:hypothetical protein